MEDSSMYILQDVPGKGKGLIARKNISTGTRILVEQPVVTIPEHQRDDEWLRRHISQQVDSLTKEQRLSFMSLHNIHPYNCTTEKYLGIIRTTGLPIEADGISGGIFLEACRINHACDNNAQKNWNKRIQRHTVHALRDIPEGEEITIYYLGLKGSREVRRQKLQNKFGFLCSCRMCSLNSAESQQSDESLERIVLLNDLIGKKGMSMNFSQGMLRLVDEQIQLYNKQGLDRASLPRAYIDAAQIAIANGDLARGRTFAERAVESWRIAYGSDSDEVFQYTSLAQNPASLKIHGMSKHWKTPLGEVPPQTDSDGYENWLWRRERPEKTFLSGQTTSLRSIEIFPGFSDLPGSGIFDLDALSYSDGDDQPSRHWCFLGEITGSATLHHLELELTDVNGKIFPLHFNTDGRGSELGGAQVRPGYTVAVLYAKRHRFMYGDPGIKHVDPQFLKVLPISLIKLLQLSDRVQQFSGDAGGIRTCHGCNKKTASMNRCGKCSLFWYCNNACQITGWVKRGHKTDCKSLKDSDLRGLLVMRWEELETRVRFPLVVGGSA